MILSSKSAIQSPSCDSSTIPSSSSVILLITYLPSSPPNRNLRCFLLVICPPSHNTNTKNVIPTALLDSYWYESSRAMTLPHSHNILCTTELSLLPLPTTPQRHVRFCPMGPASVLPILTVFSPHRTACTVAVCSQALCDSWFRLLSLVCIVSFAAALPNHILVIRLLQPLRCPNRHRTYHSSW